MGEWSMSEKEVISKATKCEDLKSALHVVARGLCYYFGDASNTFTYAVPYETNVAKIAAEVVEETTYYTLEITWKRSCFVQWGKEDYEFTLKRTMRGSVKEYGMFDKTKEDKEKEVEKPTVSTYATELVFKRILEERAYQESFVDEKGLCKKHSVTAELLQMEEYLARARTAWVNGKGDTEALHMIRKVLAIGVRCGENHPLPKR